MEENSIQIKKNESNKITNNNKVFSIIYFVIFAFIYFILLAFAILEYFILGIDEVNGGTTIAFLLIEFLILILYASLLVMATKEYNFNYLIEKIGKKIFILTSVAIISILIIQSLRFYFNFNPLFYCIGIVVIAFVIGAYLILKNYKRNSLLSKIELDEIKVKIKNEFLEKNKFIDVSDESINSKILRDVRIVVLGSALIMIVLTKIPTIISVSLIIPYFLFLFYFTNKLVKKSVLNKVRFYTKTIIVSLLIGVFLALSLYDIIPILLMPKNDLIYILLLSTTPYAFAYKNFTLVLFINRENKSELDNIEEENDIKDDLLE